MKRTPFIVALYFIITLTQTSSAVSQWIKTAFPSQNYPYQVTVSAKHRLYVTTGIGALQSSDHGDSWDKFGLEIGYTIFGHGAIGFASGNEGIYRTLDTGNSWQLIYEIHNPVVMPVPVAFAPNGNIYGLGYHFPNHLFFISKDNGTTWDSLPGLKMKDDNWITEVISLTISSNGVLFAGSNSGLFSSTDEGKSWTKHIVIDENDKILSVAVNSKHQIFVGMQQFLMCSTDDGTTWSHTWDPPIPCGGVPSIAVDPSDRIFIGTECDGVLYSPDNGKTWITLNDTVLYNSIVDDITIDPAGYVYAAVDGTLFRRLLSDLSAPASVTQSVASPMSTYPNPFTASTTITFSTDKPTNSQISIYNLLGSEVTQLFSGSLDAGKHSFTWDAHAMPAGMYLCTIRSGDDVKKIPLMLVRD